MLVVTAILAVLCGILAAVVARSRGKAQDATDISNLHQLAIAMTLYQSEAGGLIPLSPPELVNLGFAPKSVLASPNDSTRLGLSNELVKELGRNTTANVEPYRVSYPGALQYGFHRDYYEKYIQSAHNPGWAVCIVHLKPGEHAGPELRSWVGPYLRLMLDGSVQARRQSVTPLSEGGQPVWFISSHLLFIDESAEYVINQK